MVSADYVWMNGEFVAFEDAKVHVLTHALHYGTSVFEGVRCYETDEGPCSLPPQGASRAAVPVGAALPHGDPVLPGRAQERDRRADRPQQLPRMLHPPARLPRRRPDGPVPAELAGRRHDRDVGVGDLPRRRGQAQRRPCGRLSWRRIDSGSVIPAAKAGGQYLNSILAKIESEKAGYEEGILLDHRGMVCEGTGENLFIVKDGKVATPHFTLGHPRRHQPRIGDRDHPRPRLRPRGARRRPR